MSRYEDRSKFKISGLKSSQIHITTRKYIIYLIILVNSFKSNT